MLELGIFASQFIWLIRTRKLRARAKREGIKFDDMPEAKKYQWSRPTPPPDDGQSSSDVERSAGAEPEKDLGANVADLRKDSDVGSLGPISTDVESTLCFSRELEADIEAVIEKNGAR